VSSSTVPPSPAPIPPPVAPVPPAAGAAEDLTERGVVRHDSVRARTWRLRGTSKVSGDVAVESADLHGQLVVGGAVRAGTFRMEGAAEIAGPVAIRNDLGVEGTFRAGATVSARSARLRGSIHIAGAVEIEQTLEMRGESKAASIKAAELEIQGGAEVAGPIVAGVVSIDLDRSSRFDSIAAGRVSARLRGPTPIERVFGETASAVIGRIEADSVELERVDVEFVRSKEIHLGRDAHVTSVEGTIVSRHPTSRVGPESRSPPPPGLSR
jgi:cytoskeletal protein CcmA (bactofilin family)